jgi:hypothetical protein
MLALIILIKWLLLVQIQTVIKVFIQIILLCIKIKKIFKKIKKSLLKEVRKIRICLNFIICLPQLQLHKMNFIKI